MLSRITFLVSAVASALILVACGGAGSASTVLSAESTFFGAATHEVTALTGNGDFRMAAVDLDGVASPIDVWSIGALDADGRPQTVVTFLPGRNLSNLVGRRFVFKGTLTARGLDASSIAEINHVERYTGTMTHDVTAISGNGDFRMRSVAIDTFAAPVDVWAIGALDADGRPETVVTFLPGRTLADLVGRRFAIDGELTQRGIIATAITEIPD